MLIVPDTSVLDLMITAPRPERAESITAEVLTEAAGYLSELDSPVCGHGLGWVEDEPAAPSRQRSIGATS